MTDLKKINNEYQKLKTELFGNSSFAVYDQNCPKWKRYNQLFQFFHPRYRSKDWVNPCPTAELITSY